MRFPRWPAQEDDTELFPRWTGNIKTGWFGRVYAEASVPVPNSPFYMGAQMCKLVWVPINEPVLKQILNENSVLRGIAAQYDEERQSRKKGS